MRDSFDKKIDQFLILWDSIKPLETKVTFLGYSNGANFILDILEKCPTVADNVVLMHPSNLGYTFKEFSSCSLLMTSGAIDMISLPSESLQLSKQLSTHFYPVSFELLDSGH